jgi:hypothetical protein
MGHSAESYVFLELPGNELGAIIGNDPGKGAWKALARSLNNNLHIHLRHPLTDLPVNNKATVTIQVAAKIIKSPTDV